MTHTPGPWEAVNIGMANPSHNTYVEVYDIMAGYERLTTVAGTDNAKLVAAAPELLNALLEISRTTKGYPNASREGQIALETLDKLGFKQPE